MHKKEKNAFRRHDFNYTLSVKIHTGNVSRGKLILLTLITRSYYLIPAPEENRMKLVVGFYSVLKVLYFVSIDQYIIDGASQNSLVILRLSINATVLGAPELG